MDSFELNKIAGAVLGTCLAVLGISILSEAIFHSEAPEQPGYEIAIAEEGEAADGEAGGEDQGPDLGTLLAAADPAEGEGAIRPCAACHTFEQGGGAQVGPNLYNTVGAQKAHMDGFNYSAAMQEAAAAGETWTYEALDGFLANPRGYMPGTTMSFAGVRDPENRADIIAYLASLTENPPPLPEPAAEGGDGEAAGEAEEADATAGEGEGEAQDAAPAEGDEPVEGDDLAEPAESEASEEQPAEGGAAETGEAAGTDEAEPVDSPGNPGAAGSAGAAGEAEQRRNGVVTPHEEEAEEGLLAPEDETE